MADETLQSLGTDNKLPDALNGKQDSTLAAAWAAAKGGKIPFFTLTGAAGSKVATLAGYWVGNAPIRVAGTGEMQPSTIPPQFRAVDSKTAFDLIPKDKPTTQPDWSWKPAQPKQKPNKLK
ncbi:hypothetical protein ACFLMW_003824 [Salmonella enterica]